MKKTLNFGLKLSVICLVSSCGTFDWEPNPYTGNSLKQELVREDGSTISCAEPAFDRIVAFDEEDISALKTAIDQVKNKKLRKRLSNKFSKLYQ